MNTAMPVCLEPGSMPTSTPSTWESATVRSLSRIVNGVCRAMTARPLVRSLRALAGGQGCNGTWCLSSTNTYARDRLVRSEEHTSELQSRGHHVCRLLLE